MDVLAIASALAARYASGVITPPTGEPAVKEATHLLPNAVKTPGVYVELDGGEFSWGLGSQLWWDGLFVVRLYLAMDGTFPDRYSRVMGWYSAMGLVTAGQLKLGQPTYVDYVQLERASPFFGQEDYGGQPWDGVRQDVRVRTRETVSGMAV